MVVCPAKSKSPERVYSKDGAGEGLDGVIVNVYIDIADVTPLSLSTVTRLSVKLRSRAGTTITNNVYEADIVRSTESLAVTVNL